MEAPCYWLVGPWRQGKASEPQRTESVHECCHFGVQDDTEDIHVEVGQNSSHHLQVSQRGGRGFCLILIHAGY